MTGEREGAPTVAKLGKIAERAHERIAFLLARARDIEAARVELAAEAATFKDGELPARLFASNNRLAVELRTIGYHLTLAACELVPKDDPRRRAAERTAEDVRHRVATDYVWKPAPPLIENATAA